MTEPQNPHPEGRALKTRPDVNPGPAEGAASSAPTLPLLLEIGCEEIPARFLSQAQKELGERLRSALEEARLLPPTVGAVREPPLQTYSTPRRLVAHVAAVLERQPNLTEEVTGPPVKVAFDKDGKPTRAAESFAAKNGATVDDLYRVATPKGEYLAVKKTTYGRPTLEVLREVLPAVITGLTFPKSMYWEGSKTHFVRPIRWIVVLLGEGGAAKAVPFEIAGVKSGNETYGRRIGAQSAHDSAVAVTDFDDYARKLRERSVEFDPGERAVRVQNEVKAVLEGSGLSAVADQELEDWIVNSTEWPRALLGSFEDRFLKLPREILITVMRNHQKYFAVENGAGNLQPRFVTVLNQEGDPQGLIKKGHERVLAARFSDAEFFWNADQKVTLAERFEQGWLDRVTYQAKLGSYGDKVRRMEVIAKEICATLENQGKMTPAETAHALRAVQLCKCDLTTQMVQELTELQGVVGGLYATAQGQPKEVADAIYDHYLPASLEDRVPRNVVGAVVSLADKIDSIVAGFCAGLDFTGSSDPFGFRRAGNGIVKTIIKLVLDLPLGIIADHAAQKAIPDESAARLGTLKASIRMLLSERIRHYMETVEGLPYDTARAVLDAGARHAGVMKAIIAGRRPEPDPVRPLDLTARAKDLQSMLGSDDLNAVCAVAKRIWNILYKSAQPSDWEAQGAFDPDKLEPGVEADLYAGYVNVAADVQRLRGIGDYRSSLQAIATLRPLVDQFFDTVHVMAEDRMLRANRLFLLVELDRLFSSIADLSQIESKTLSNVDAPTS